VKRRFRVRDNPRFQEIRRQGRSLSDELLVLCFLPNGLAYNRFGFSVSSRIGNAVERNRIKRRLREAMRLRMDSIKPGWDLVLIARNPIRSADYQEMDAACARLLRRAHLFRESVPAPLSNHEVTGSGIPASSTPELQAQSDPEQLGAQEHGA
jgi:ribonuclease P protein component